MATLIKIDFRTCFPPDDKLPPVRSKTHPNLEALIRREYLTL
jgi:hypothetical protein